MHIELEINAETCVKCGRCAAVCPAGVFEKPQMREIPQIRRRNNCIVCGQCAAVCPSGSVIHSEFPPESLHKIDKALLPSPESVMLLMKKRRSRRIFRDAHIPEEKLSMILDAANSAPTAKNLQNLQYTLVSGAQKLDEIEAIVVEVFSEAAKKLSNPIIGFLAKRFAPALFKALPMLEALKKAHANGERPILRGAAAVLFIHAPKSSMFGCEDCNLAYQNASLMAESLDVAQFYTGYVMRAIQMDKKGRIKKLLGLKGNAYAGMAMGMPSVDFPNYADKRRVRLKRI